MLIRILTSCTYKKAHRPSNLFTHTDFKRIHDVVLFLELESRLGKFRTKAQDTYIGQQHTRLMHGVRELQQQRGQESVDLWILSAGYGLIPAHQQIVPYECTFRGMKRLELEAWSRHLHIPKDAKRLFALPADLLLVLLGEEYLAALRLNDSTQFTPSTLFITAQGPQRWIKGHGPIQRVLLSREHVKQFSTPQTALKGEVAKRLLHRLSTEGYNFLHQLVCAKEDVLSLL